MKLPINTPLLITLHDGTQFVGTASDEPEGQWVTPTVYDGYSWLVEKVKDWRPVGGWISVDERLPEVAGVYLAFVLGDYDIVEYHPKYGWLDSDTVTHWQPLPAPPEATP